MTVTIEEISGKKHTVVWHGEVCNIFGAYLFKAHCGYLSFACAPDEDVGEHLATALPALPRYPKAEDAWLLHLYAAHGIAPHITNGDGYRGSFVGLLEDRWSIIGSQPYGDSLYTLTIVNSEITHATYNGERVEIAIEETNK
jgi:hypothetical protein